MIGKSYKLMQMTPEMKKLYEAVQPPEEPPANCQDCERRHSQCAEFTALNKPNWPYNREYCHWFKKEEKKDGCVC